jgi:hypothetical protein
MHKTLSHTNRSGTILSGRGTYMAIAGGPDDEDEDDDVIVVVVVLRTQLLAYQSGIEMIQAKIQGTSVATSFC